jgi:hypothetical protein
MKSARVIAVLGSKVIEQLSARRTDSRDAAVAAIDMKSNEIHASATVLRLTIKGSVLRPFPIPLRGVSAQVRNSQLYQGRK